MDLTAAAAAAVGELFLPRFATKKGMISAADAYHHADGCSSSTTAAADASHHVAVVADDDDDYCNDADVGCSHHGTTVGRSAWDPCSSRGTHGKSDEERDDDHTSSPGSSPHYYYYSSMS